MKKYIKPHIEETALDTRCQLMAASDVYNTVGNSQLAPGKKGSSDDEEDDGLGW